MAENLPEFPPQPEPTFAASLEPQRDYLVTIIVGAVLIALTVAGAYIKAFQDHVFSHKPEEWGALGSYYSGLVGPLFSFLGVILIYRTFRAQKRNSDLQQFESTFFSLLATQRDIAKNMYGESKGVGGAQTSHESGGYAYLHAAAEQLKDEMQRQSDTIEPEKIPGLTAQELPATRAIVWPQVRAAYEQMYDGKQSQLDHYFRHLYHIVKYIRKSYIDEADKREYADIVQAQMSDDELYLAFYNGIGEHGYPNFYRLMEDYQFTENMRDRGDKHIIALHKRLFYPRTYPGD